MKKKIKKIALWLVGVVIFGAAAINPESEQLNSLAMAYAWIMALIFIFAMICLVGIAACASADDETVSRKSKAALEKMREEDEKATLFTWLRFALQVSLLALTGMVFTTIVYAAIGLIGKFVSAIILAKPQEAEW